MGQAVAAKNQGFKQKLQTPELLLWIFSDCAFIGVSGLSQSDNRMVPRMPTRGLEPRQTCVAARCLNPVTIKHPTHRLTRRWSAILQHTQPPDRSQNIPQKTAAAWMTHVSGLGLPKTRNCSKGLLPLIFPDLSIDAANAEVLCFLLRLYGLPLRRLATGNEQGR